MNCERFQENLHDYVDDTLSPAEKAAAQAHLGECSACRELLQDEWLIGQVLSGRLREAVETVTLDACAQRRMADAVRKKIGNVPEAKKTFSLPSWIRFVIPAAAAVLIAAIWFGRGLVDPRDLRNIVSSTSPTGFEVPVHVSYPATHYTFRQEGGMVVDALISDTRVADGSLLAKNKPNRILYDH